MSWTVLCCGRIFAVNFVEVAHPETGLLPAAGRARSGEACENTIVYGPGW
jgi:hypothetical protein